MVSLCVSVCVCVCVCVSVCVCVCVWRDVQCFVETSLVGHSSCDRALQNKSRCHVAKPERRTRKGKPKAKRKRTTSLNHLNARFAFLLFLLWTLIVASVEGVAGSESVAWRPLVKKSSARPGEGRVFRASTSSMSSSSLTVGRVIDDGLASPLRWLAVAARPNKRQRNWRLARSKLSNENKKEINKDERKTQYNT